MILKQRKGYSQLIFSVKTSHFHPKPGVNLAHKKRVTILDVVTL
jgi:hypothetical protein